MSRTVWLGAIAVALFFTGVLGYALGWDAGHHAGWRARGRAR